MFVYPMLQALVAFGTGQHSPTFQLLLKAISYIVLVACVAVTSFILPNASPQLLALDPVSLQLCYHSTSVVLMGHPLRATILASPAYLSLFLYQDYTAFLHSSLNPGQCAVHSARSILAYAPYGCARAMLLCMYVLVLHLTTLPLSQPPSIKTVPAVCAEGAPQRKRQVCFCLLRLLYKLAGHLERWCYTRYQPLEPALLKLALHFITLAFVVVKFWYAIFRIANTSMDTIKDTESHVPVAEATAAVITAFALGGCVHTLNLSSAQHQMQQLWGVLQDVYPGYIADALISHNSVVIDDLLTSCNTTDADATAQLVVGIQNTECYPGSPPCGSVTFEPGAVAHRGMTADGQQDIDDFLFADGSTQNTHDHASTLSQHESTTSASTPDVESHIATPELHLPSKLTSLADALHCISENSDDMQATQPHSIQRTPTAAVTATITKPDMHCPHWHNSPPSPRPLFTQHIRMRHSQPTIGIPESSCFRSPRRASSTFYDVEGLSGSGDASIIPRQISHTMSCISRLFLQSPRASAAGEQRGAGFGSDDESPRHRCSQTDAMLGWQDRAAAPQHSRSVMNVAHCSDFGRWHDCVTVLFADIEGFTRISEQIEADAVMRMLNSLWHNIDALTQKMGVYKVDTVGDGYLAATNLTESDPDHAATMLRFALAIQQEAAKVLSPTDGKPLRMRIGMHSGPVMSGLVGDIRRKYSIFGDTVNTASRMETTGDTNRIQISGDTYCLILGSRCEVQGLQVECRGEMEMKGKTGTMITYWVSSAGPNAV